MLKIPLPDPLSILRHPDTPRYAACVTITVAWGEPYSFTGTQPVTKDKSRKDHAKLTRREKKTNSQTCFPELCTANPSILCDQTLHGPLPLPWGGIYPLSNCDRSASCRLPMAIRKHHPNWQLGHRTLPKGRGKEAVLVHGDLFYDLGPAVASFLGWNPRANEPGRFEPGRFVNA